MARPTRSALPAAVTLALGVLLTVGVVGCGGGSGGEGTTGTLRVAITDQASEYLEVHIAISEIRVVPGGPESPAQAGLPLIEAFDPPRDVDIMQLHFQHEYLGTEVVPAGQYNQVRLVLAPNEAGQDPVNYLILASDPDTKVPLRTPSGQQSGLKILGQFEVAEAQSQTIVLDFDPNAAIVEAGNSGNYNLKPTGIRISEILDFPPGYGALLGVVDPADAWDDALVEAIPVGETDPVASGAVSPDDGSFRLFVEPGDYNLRVTATDYDEGTLGPFTAQTATDTDVGTLALTLTPPGP